jgi:diguanylate cyclase (GGDEF)-like protein
MSGTWAIEKARMEWAGPALLDRDFAVEEMVVSGRRGHYRRIDADVSGDHRTEIAHESSAVADSRKPAEAHSETTSLATRWPAPEDDLRDELLDHTSNVVATLARLALTDPLTGLPNRRAVEERLRAEIARCARYQRQLAVIVVDVDDLKLVNDRRGHLCGDELLRAIGRLIEGAVRTTDFVGRWGGDEFVVLCPEAHVDGTRRVADKLRDAVAAQRFELRDGALHATVSLGWAVGGQSGDASSLLAAADAGLYGEKRRALRSRTRRRGTATVPTPD